MRIKHYLFLQSRPEVRGDKIGVFGIGYGAFTALYCAGLENRFVAAGGIGAPFLDVDKVRKQALAAQRRSLTRYRAPGLTKNTARSWHLSRWKESSPRFGVLP